MKLHELAQLLDARLIGDGDLEIARPVPPAEVTGPGDLAVVLDPKAVANLKDSGARMALVGADFKLPEDLAASLILVGRPRYALAALTRTFDPGLGVVPGVHPSAVVAEDAELGPDVTIGPFCLVGAGARIGAGTVLTAHVSVGAGARIGAGGLLHDGVRVGARVVLGDRVIAQPNAVIGADGFSFATPEAGNVDNAREGKAITDSISTIERIQSLGSVVVGDDVEIGAGSTIDRGTLSDTHIGRGTKIDNLVTVAHNVRIGEYCFLCGQAGIAGSSTLGDRVVLAGQVGVADHVTIGSDSVVAAGGGVGRDFPPKSLLYGYPAQHKEEAWEQLMNIRRLRHLYREVEQLRDQVARLGGQDS